jgi:hypothetical protein
VCQSGSIQDVVRAVRYGLDADRERGHRPVAVASMWLRLRLGVVALRTGGMRTGGMAMSTCRVDRGWIVDESVNLNLETSRALIDRTGPGPGPGTQQPTAATTERRYRKRRPIPLQFTHLLRAPLPRRLPDRLRSLRGVRCLQEFTALQVPPRCNCAITAQPTMLSSCQ